MKIRTRLFGIYKEKAGKREVLIDLTEGATVADLLGKLSQEFPDLNFSHRNLVVAVNTEYVKTEAQLHEGDEVALIPPVSGG